MLKKLILLIFIVIVFFICFYYGKFIPMKEQIPLFEGLRNTSAIVFGVMGAWIAVLHPDSLKEIFGQNRQNIPKKDRETIKQLLSPILISTCILSVVLIIPLFISIGKTIPILLQYQSTFRSASFSLLGCLTFLQLWALILTLIPGDIMKRNIQKQEAKDKVIDNLFSETKKNNK